MSDMSTWGWAAKVDAHGRKIWEKSFGKKARNSEFYRATAVAHGEVFLVGTVNARWEQLGEASSAWLVKLGKEGNVIWDKVIDFGRATRALNVKSSRNGDIVVLGISRQKEKDSTFILLFDPLGNIKLKKVISYGASLQGNSIELLAGGEMVIGGRILLNDKNHYSAWIAHLDKAGKVVWQRVLQPEKDAQVTTISSHPEGIFVGVEEQLPDKNTKISIVEMAFDGSVKLNKQLIGHGLCGISTIFFPPPDFKRKIIGAGRKCPGDKMRTWAGVILPVEESHLFERILLPEAEVESVLFNKEGNLVAILNLSPKNDLAASALLISEVIFSKNID